MNSLREVIAALFHRKFYHGESRTCKWWCRPKRVPIRERGHRAWYYLRRNSNLYEIFLFVKPAVIVLSSHECRGIGITAARVAIENFWVRCGQDVGEKWARTFTNFDVGTVYFRHMGVQVRRICTIFYVESVLKIFASFPVITYVSNMYERIYLDQS